MQKKIIKNILLGTLISCSAFLGATFASESDLGNEVSRVSANISNGNIVDQYGNPITKVDVTTENFGEDDHGPYWNWNSDSSRGGGFYIDLNQPLGDEYTVAVKFSYSDVNGAWKKILDYKNRKNDDGFYFANNGHLIFYRGGNRGDQRQQFKNDEVLDLVITRFADGRFVVYSMKEGQLEKELEVSLGLNDTTFEVVDGKTRLGFFFDDMATSSEATRSGKFYSVRVWDKAVDDEIIKEKIDKITKIPTPPQNETYNPTGEDTTVDKNQTINPRDVITNISELPENTTFTWKENPDTTTPGTRPVTVIVTYPDNSSEEVTVNLTVRPDNADENNPNGEDKTIDEGSPLSPEDIITNKDDLPPNTTFAWKDEPDTNTPGTRPVTVVVTYPDNSSEEITVNITVRPVNDAVSPNPPTVTLPIADIPQISQPSNSSGGAGGYIPPTTNVSVSSPIPNNPKTPSASLPPSPTNKDTDFVTPLLPDESTSIRPVEPNGLLPTQNDLTPAGRTKSGERIFTLNNRLTDYICPQIVQAYPRNKLRVVDTLNNPFVDDIDALMMYRGLEKDEMNLGQTYQEYRKHGVVLNVPKFEPYRNVTRAEFVKMLVRSLSCRYTFMGTDTGFSDVASNKWYAEYISFAVKNGWINGYKDGTFRPNNPITRDEAAKILSRAIQLTTQNYTSTTFTDVEHNSEFIPYIETLKHNGIMKGRNENIFAPKDFIPRTETSRMIYRTFFGGKIGK